MWVCDFGSLFEGSIIFLQWYEGSSSYDDEESSSYDDEKSSSYDDVFGVYIS